MAFYQLLEHTADLGIRVLEKDLESIFINSARAMSDLIADISTIKPVIPVKIKVQAQDRDELLKNWLSELLYHFHVKEMLFSKFDIEIFDDKTISSVATGEKVCDARHSFKNDIKAVTFHALNIHRTGNQLSTDIVFDI